MVMQELYKSLILNPTLQSIVAYRAINAKPLHVLKSDISDSMHALTPTCMLKKDAARACAAVLTEVKTVPGVSILLLRMMHTPFCPAREKKFSN